MSLYIKDTILLPAFDFLYFLMEPKELSYMQKELIKTTLHTEYDVFLLTYKNYTHRFHYALS